MYKSPSMRQVRGAPGSKGGSAGQAIANRGPGYEYKSVGGDCNPLTPRSGEDRAVYMTTCVGDVLGCVVANPPDKVGAASVNYRRTTVDGRPTGEWGQAGVSCTAGTGPGAQPTISMADITAQFMRTPWAKPHISSQPAGNVTLVNLPTFYQVTWSQSGFEPGEVDSSVLRGFMVRIRPKLVGFTYVFGDGSTLGPTMSSGGVYPDGDVTHEYKKRGKFPVRVNTTFGADFSLDGGTWEEIPSTVTVPGPATTITVKEARAVLVNN